MNKPEDLGKWCEERLNSVEYLQQQLVIAQEERDEARKRLNELIEGLKEGLASIPTPKPLNHVVEAPSSIKRLPQVLREYTTKSVCSRGKVTLTKDSGFKVSVHVFNLLGQNTDYEALFLSMDEALECYEYWVNTI